MHKEKMHQDTGDTYTDRLDFAYEGTLTRTLQHCITTVEIPSFTCML